MDLEKADKLYDQLLLVSKAMLMKLEAEAKRLGYNKTEFIIIRDILDHPDTHLIQIGERTGLKKSALSKSITQLIDKGIIDRKPSETDGREYTLSIRDEEVKTSFCKATLLSDLFSGPISCNSEMDEISLKLDELITLMDKP